MSGNNTTNFTTAEPKKYKGVRRRKWGKWVSEIRVPGTQERLWLGSYATPEAAAVAHDVASYCLKGQQQSCMDGKLNFPLMLPASLRENMSPKSIQKAASDAGMAIDAHMILNTPNDEANNETVFSHDQTLLGWEDTACAAQSSEGLSISVEDYF